MSAGDKKKAELEKDPEFAKIVKSLRMKAPLAQILNKVKAEGKFDVEDILLFCEENVVANARKNGLVGPAGG